MLRIRLLILISFLFAVSARGTDCGGNTFFNCPTTSNFNVCPEGSLQDNIIIRCMNGCPSGGNCNDNLAGVPPIGVKLDAKCYQDSPTAGNAQCTFNCVNVTRLDGSVFYPVGCTSLTSSSTSSTSTSSTSTSSTSTSSTSTSSTSTSSTTASSTSTSSSATTSSSTSQSATNSSASSAPTVIVPSPSPPPFTGNAAVVLPQVVGAGATLILVLLPFLF